MAVFYIAKTFGLSPHEVIDTFSMQEMAYCMDCISKYSKEGGFI